MKIRNMTKVLSSIKMLAAIVLPAIVIMLTSCYPNDNLSVSETDIVMVGYYDSVNFKALKTYYMSDTVYPVREDTSDHSLIKYNNEIISAIASNMEAYGYTRILEVTTDTPDVRVSSASITIKNVTVGWWYPYYPGWRWGWGYKKSTRDTDYYYPGYPGFYPPGYGWGYPYYSSYTTGTLLIEMADPDDYEIIKNDTVTPIYWSGAINGVLSSGSDLNRITKGIDKAFELSPEIKTN